MDQFINQNLILCTIEENSVGCHGHFLKDLSIFLSHKDSYDYMMIYQTIIKFIPNELRVNLHICDN